MRRLLKYCMGFIVSTDSCCDVMRNCLTDEKVSQLALEYIAAENGKVETARDSFSSDEEYVKFYERMSKGMISKTSQLTALEHFEYFEKLILEYKKDIVHITLSSGLSGTFDQAVIAAQMIAQNGYENKVYAVDSISAAGGQRLLVDKLVSLNEEGKSASEAAAILEEFKIGVHHWIVIDDLNHLKRGGRISGAKAAIGTMLNLKPLVGINHEGRLVILGKNKGMKKSIAKLMDVFGKYKNAETNKVYVVHSNAHDVAVSIQAELKKISDVESEIIFLGPVIGSHTGPGTVAIAFHGEQRITDY